MNETFPVTYSTPSPEALKRVIQEDYHLGLVTDCKLLYRSVNDTFLVVTQDSKFIFRIYRLGWRKHSEILYELEALLHLDARNVSVSTPILREDGGLVGVIKAPEGPRHVVLFTYAPGKEPTYDIETESALYGRAVARVHAQSETFRGSHERFRLDMDHLLDTPVRSIQPFLSHRKDDWEYVKRLASKLRRQLDALPLDRLERGFCHGDFHSGNGHLQGNDEMIFFDFDCCGFGWRAYDIAVFRWNARHNGKDKDRWPLFLRGYRNERPLTDTDVKATDIFVAVRHLWLLNLHICIGRDAGYGFLNDRYFDRGLEFLRKWEIEFLGEDADGRGTELTAVSEQ